MKWFEDMESNDKLGAVFFAAIAFVLAVGAICAAAVEIAKALRPTP